MKGLKILYTAILSIAAFVCCVYLLFTLKSKELFAFSITLVGLTNLLTYKSVKK